MSAGILLSLMATTLALSLYLMWKAIKVLPKQPFSIPSCQAASSDDGVVATNASNA